MAKIKWNIELEPSNELATGWLSKAFVALICALGIALPLIIMAT